MIGEILRFMPATRDDNRTLCTEIWRRELLVQDIKANVHSIDFFFKLYEMGKLSSADYITRTSRLLQETNPDIAGKRRENQYLQEKMKEEIEEYKSERVRP